MVKGTDQELTYLEFYVELKSGVNLSYAAVPHSVNKMQQVKLTDLQSTVIVSNDSHSTITQLP